MKGPGRLTLVASAGCLLALGWLYGGDLLDAARARSAEVAALDAPPRVGWAVAVLALGLASAAVVAFGLLRGKGAEFKGYRLPPIVLVVALFMDLFGLSTSRSPLAPAERMGLALSRLGVQANALAASGALPSEAALRPFLAELGEPPYLVRGQPARGFALQARQGCTGPVAEAPGAAVGTFLYCLAPDGRTAWLSVVALPAESRFGAPAVLSRDGRPAAILVRAGDAPSPTGPVLPDDSSP